LSTQSNTPSSGRWQRGINQSRDANERLDAGDTLTPRPAEGPIDEAASGLVLALIEGPLTGFAKTAGESRQFYRVK